VVPSVVGTGQIGLTGRRSRRCPPLLYWDFGPPGPSKPTVEQRPHSPPAPCPEPGYLSVETEPFRPRRRGRARLGQWLGRLHFPFFVLTIVTLMAAGERYGGAVPYALWVLAILGSHEMGHYLACRYHGVPASLPFFIPGPWPLGTFGAVIRMRGPIPNRKALFDIAVAGPLAGFLVALPALIIGLLQAEPFDPGPDSQGWAFSFGSPLLMTLMMDRLVDGFTPQLNPSLAAAWVGLLVTSFNLFPVGQLDGGHTVYALSRRAHRIVARTTLVALLSLIITQISMGIFSAYVVWFLILLWMRDRHPRLLDETSPLGTVRACIAVLLLLIFLLSFIFVPIQVVDV